MVSTYLGCKKGRVYYIIIARLSSTSTSVDSLCGNRKTTPFQVLATPVYPYEISDPTLCHLGTRTGYSWKPLTLRNRTVLWEVTGHEGKGVGREVRGGGGAGIDSEPLHALPALRSSLLVSLLLTPPHPLSRTPCGAKAQYDSHNELHSFRVYQVHWTWKQFCPTKVIANRLKKLIIRSRHVNQDLSDKIETTQK